MNYVTSLKLRYQQVSMVSELQSKCLGEQPKMTTIWTHKSQWHCAFDLHAQVLSPVHLNGNLTIVVAHYQLPTTPMHVTPSQRH